MELCLLVQIDQKVDFDMNLNQSRIEMPPRPPPPSSISAISFI